MSNKTRSILKAISVILVLIAVMMAVGWISIPILNPYKFWIVVGAFGLLIISSK